MKKIAFKWVGICACIIVGIFMCSCTEGAQSAGNEFENTEMKTENSLNVVMGKTDGEGLTYLDAGEISGIDCSLIDMVEKQTSDIAWYQQVVKDEIQPWVEDGAEGFILSSTENLRVSTYNMAMVSTEKNSVCTVYEFLFLDDVPVGSLAFFQVDGELDHSISLYTPETRGFNLDFLEKNKDVNYILLTDGLNSYFLSEENEIYNPLYSDKADVNVTGDCYNALGEEVAVSYEDVYNQIISIN